MSRAKVFHVSVTAEDIAMGVPCRSRLCPVARAVCRARESECPVSR